jgi:ubiquinone/menaquinone biosynthesis C-methylase UbiE
MDVLELQPRSTVFDQCCGTGVMSFALAERGVKVVGVDLCQKYINQAATVANRQGLDCRFVQGDAFQYTVKPACDAAINWWTSFGYAEEDDRNQQMLRQAFASLKPGGRFALDYPNMANYLSACRAQETHIYESQDGSIEVLRESEIDLVRGLRRQIWTFTMPDGKELKHDTAIKIYLPHSVTSMLRACGFEEVTLYGDNQHTKLSLKHSRCTFIARKPFSTTP